MNEEKIYGDPGVETENIYEVPQNAYEMPQGAYEVPVQQPVYAKKGFATAALVFGILAFLTTLFLLNYIFGILALIFGIVYLVKKADVKPKGKAVTGIVLAALSLVISTTLWVSAYVYITKTDVTQIMEDVSGLLGEEIDGREMLNEMIASSTGNMITLDTIEAFIGGEVTVEKMIHFVGDVSEEELNTFINEFNTYDEVKIMAIAIEFGGEITYEGLEAKLGEDFTLRELMDYIRNITGGTIESVE